MVPRVTQAIAWMPYYVGDRVKKGQLLARLETSALDPSGDAQRYRRTCAAGRGRCRLGVPGGPGEVSRRRRRWARPQGELAQARAMLGASEQGRCRRA